jgi:G3E family GTPase
MSSQAKINAVIPVSVITGFLGSGKTTLLRRLLAHPGMGETAVLINEFGEVGLDHLLVRKVNEDIILLNSGCLCCTVRNDLVESLGELWTRRAAGDVPAFGRVVIETTGLADPAPIIHTLMTEASLAANYQPVGLVATVDATHGERQLDEHIEALKQAAMADRLVVTKTDLESATKRARLHSRLAALNPAASVFDASLAFGPTPHELFDAPPFALDGRSRDVQRWLRDEAFSLERHGHGHDINRHDDRIGAFCLTAQVPLDWQRFIAWLELLLASRGDQLLRMKGILDVAGRTRPVIIQGVQHVFYPPTELDVWPDGVRRSRIVFITRDLTRSAVERSFERVIVKAADAPSALVAH